MVSNLKLLLVLKKAIENCWAPLFGIYWLLSSFIIYTLIHSENPVERVVNHYKSIPISFFSYKKEAIILQFPFALQNHRRYISTHFLWEHEIVSVLWSNQLNWYSELCRWVAKKTQFLTATWTLALIKTIFLSYPVMMMMNHYPMKVFPLAPFNHKFMEVLCRKLCKNRRKWNYSAHYRYVAHNWYWWCVIKIKRAPFQWAPEWNRFETNYWNH